MNSCVDPKTSKYFDTFIDTLRSIQAIPDIPVFIGTPSVSSCSASKYILYNTEQLTIATKLGELLKTVKTRPPVVVWDYSLVNISILNSHGIMNTKHVPLTTSRETIAKLRSFRTSVQYDIGFNGALTERRKKILDGLTEAGVSVHSVTLWGEERDRELAKCRYILNIHADEDYMVFESARCVPWLDSGIPVLSERSIIDDPRCITASYDNLIDTCIYHVRNTSEGFLDYTVNYTYILIATVLLLGGLKYFIN
jgi:hypothetical protein